MPEPKFQFFDDVLEELRWWAEHFHGWEVDKIIGEDSAKRAKLINQFIQDMEEALK